MSPRSVASSTSSHTTARTSHPASPQTTARTSRPVSPQTTARTSGRASPQTTAQPSGPASPQTTARAVVEPSRQPVPPKARRSAVGVRHRTAANAPTDFGATVAPSRRLPSRTRAGVVRPRRALVLGGGGVLGFAWTVGALSAVMDERGLEVADFDVVIGTSAGSVLAALLSCGLPVDGIRRHHQGVPLPADPVIDWDYDAGAGGALPPRPGLLPGSPRLVASGLLGRHRPPVVVALSGLLPKGRGSLAPVAAMVDGLRPARRAWPRRPQPWIVVTDYDSGERAVFGWRDGVHDRPDGFRLARPGGTPKLGTAVAASCSIPGWYAPVRVEGRTYIDGGTASNSSLDLLLDPDLGGDLEQVFVLAPMAAGEFDRPRGTARRVERTVRRAITRTIDSDAAALRGAGVEVNVLAPDVDDLALIGANMMNPRRRRDVLDAAEAGVVRRLRAAATDGTLDRAAGA